MTLGFYENFPTSIHRIDNFTSTLSSKQLQQKLIQVFYEVNCKEFTFEEVANPTVPEGKVIFEFGLAEAENFNFIDEEELKKTLDFLAKAAVSFDGFFLFHTLLQGRWRKKDTVKV